MCLLGRGSALLIEQVSVSDTATYTCSAYNFAERNASVHVTVHCEYHVLLALYTVLSVL